MKDTSDREEAVHRALEDARRLADMGVPIVCGPLDDAGNPTGPMWNGWERTRPSHRAIDRWSPGQALAAVTGGRFDVLDVDPRAGGMESLQRLSDMLGDNAPEEYWRVRTSSGGRHIWIAKLGIGRSIHFLPGLDLLGKPSLAFLPPTVRPSKDPSNAGQRVAYRGLTDLTEPIGNDGTGGHLRDLITELLARRNGGGPGSARTPLSELEQACVGAENGGQREALLALAMELQRKFDDDEFVMFKLRAVRDRMETFDRRRPWTDRDLAGLLLSGDRRPIADSAGSEADLLASLRGDGPMVARATGGLKRLSGVSAERLKWLWFRYLAFGDASLIDSFAGAGKSLTSLDIVARATRGRGMPCAEEVLSGPLNVLLLAPEDRAPVQRMRLEAAGADLDRVFIPDVEVRDVRVGRKSRRTERKAYLGGHLITFPTSTEQFHNWIKEYDIGLVVIDPIAAFLDQDINSSNDASVRRALEPFVTILGMESCAAWLIRHFNKDSSQAAALRGGGSVAFGAVARTHMIAGEMPEDGSEATHAIALVKTNNVKRRKGVALGYVVEDSDIDQDDVGSKVPVVRWVGEVPVDVEELAGKQRKGPAPTTQLSWRTLLDDMFAESDTWAVKDVQARAEAAGLPWDNHTFDKVLDRIGVRKERRKNPEGRGTAFFWTNAKPRIGRPPGSGRKK